MGSKPAGSWVLGRPEIFFEGSWSQICRARFDGPDADVVCRQLGFGPGTISPVPVALPEASPLVFPPAAVTLPGCDGSEQTLLECGADTRGIGARTDSVTRDCLEEREFALDVRPGLTIACVASQEVGALLSNVDCRRPNFDAHGALTHWGQHRKCTARTSDKTQPAMGWRQASTL